MPRWLLAAPFIAVTLAYGNHFDNGFHIDDWHTIESNPAIRSLGNFPSFFLDARTSSVLPANQMYRPVVTASLAVDYALGHGYVLPWFHISTFAIFLAQLVAMWSLYRIVLRKSGAAPRFEIVAPIAVTWYGLHPAIAETVNYIIQRADLYSTCGVVFAILLYAAFPKWRRYGLYLVPAALALFSKPPAAAFPLLLLAYVLFFDRNDRAPIRAAIVRVLPALTLTIGALWFQHVMTPRTFAPITNDGRSFLATQPFVLMRFFGTAILPTHLNPDSGLAPLPYASFEAICGYAFVLAFAALAIAFARRASLRPAAFGMFWFLIAAMPAAVFPVSQTENDHRMFFPFVGLLFAFVWIGAVVVDRLFARGVFANAPKFLLPGTIVALLACYAAGTIVRNRIWHDDISMWSEVVVHRPSDSHSIMNLGLSEMKAGNYVAADAEFKHSERLDPRYPELQINEAVLAGATGHPDRVEPHFRKAIALGPDDDSTHFWYAKYLREHGNLRESEREARRAVELNPAAIDDRTLLLTDENELGDRAAARSTARDTLALAPQDILAQSVIDANGSNPATHFIYLAFQSYRQHRYAEAIAEAREAIAIDPSCAIAYNDIGVAEAQLSDWDGAIAADQKALSLDPTLAITKTNLQWALAHRGH